MKRREFLAACLVAPFVPRVAPAVTPWMGVDYAVRGTDISVVATRVYAVGMNGVHTLIAEIKHKPGASVGDSYLFAQSVLNKKEA